MSYKTDITRFSIKSILLNLLRFLLVLDYQFKKVLELQSGNESIKCCNLNSESYRLSVEYFPKPWIVYTGDYLQKFSLFFTFCPLHKKSFDLMDCIYWEHKQEETLDTEKNVI